MLSEDELNCEAEIWCKASALWRRCLTLRSSLGFSLIIDGNGKQNYCSVSKLGNV